ncbi:hypothetical protein C8Q70DRAFT_63333 [Cubamyces menziesii]|nr:hypothetical protein C8Q70DRAFT_63333 [Cubamyces menziesii]
MATGEVQGRAMDEARGPWSEERGNRLWPELEFEVDSDSAKGAPILGAGHCPGRPIFWLNTFLFLTSPTTPPPHPSLRQLLLATSPRFIRPSVPCPTPTPAMPRHAIIHGNYHNVISLLDLSYVLLLFQHHRYSSPCFLSSSRTPTCASVWAQCPNRTIDQASESVFPALIHVARLLAMTHHITPNMSPTQASSQAQSSPIFGWPLCLLQFIFSRHLLAILIQIPEPARSAAPQP